MRGMADPMLKERPANRPIPVDVVKDGRKVRVGYATNEYTRDVFKAIWKKVAGE